MKIRSGNRLTLGAFLLLLFSAASLKVTGKEELAPRLVAIGDIHGAEAPLRSILREARLIDDAGDWTGGDAVLVQTGDFLDRGAASIPVAFFLMDLQAQADASGGRVVVLLGNHEAMNLIGDMRFVPPAMLEPMIGPDSETKRLEMCKERVLILRRNARIMKEKVPSAQAARKECLEEHPLGLVEYFEALRPDARLGRWLRSLPAVVRLGDAVFLHGGLSPEMVKAANLEAINRKVRRELDDFERWRRFLVKNGRMSAAGDLVEMARAAQVELRLRGEEPDSTADGATADGDAADGDAADGDAADGDAADGDAANENDEAHDLARFFETSDSLLLRQDGPLWFRGYAAWTEEEGGRKMPEILRATSVRHLVVGHTPQNPRRIRCRFAGAVFLIDTGMLAEYYKGVPAALEILDGHAEAIYLGGERAVLLDDQYSCR